MSAVPQSILLLGGPHRRRTLCAAFLEGAGHFAFPVCDPAEAVEILAITRIDVIVELGPLPLPWRSRIAADALHVPLVHYHDGPPAHLADRMVFRRPPSPGRLPPWREDAAASLSDPAATAVN